MVVTFRVRSNERDLSSYRAPLKALKIASAFAGIFRVLREKRLGEPRQRSQPLIERNVLKFACGKYLEEHDVLVTCVLYVMPGHFGTNPTSLALESMVRADSCALKTVMRPLPLIQNCHPLPIVRNFA